jgi:transposase, IS5 family
MRPKERRETGEHDLFRSRLDQIIDLDHALVKLAKAIDWRFLEEKFGAAYTDKPGHPPLPTRLMAGLAILKHSYDLSDEALCERWVENPYFQYFCGEEFFQHRLVFDRSSLTRWRQRMGEDKLLALIQESLATAARTGAIKPSELCRVVVDTTVQEKAVMFPTDARLINRARERLVRQAKQCGVRLRQSYRRVGKLALIKHQRYAHAHQFKRANRALRKLRTYLGRVIRDIRRNTAGNDRMHEVFLRPLYLAERVLTRTADSADARSIRCTRPRSNASARARRIAPMSSASRSASPPRSSIPPAANLSPTSRRCPAILTTVIPWPRSSRRSRARRQRARPHRRRCRISRPQRTAR